MHPGLLYVRLLPAQQAALREAAKQRAAELRDDAVKASWSSLWRGLRSAATALRARLTRVAGSAGARAGSCPH